MHDPFYDLFPRREEPPWVPREIALLTIDMQYLDAHRDGWMGRVAKQQRREQLLEQRFQAIDAVLPNIRRVQDAFRATGQEVIHVRVAYRTRDARNGGRAYMPGPDVEPVPREERDDDLLPEIAPQGDEIVFSKTSASVFNSTDIDQVLHQMGIRHLVMTGLVTDGCVELSSRDAADRGYCVTLVTDACCASTPGAHEDAIQRMTDGGFIAAKTTDEAIGLLQRMKAADSPSRGLDES